MAQTTTLSSIGTSTPIMLDPVKRTTTIQCTVSATSSANFTIQYTLDDPNQTPPATFAWANVSSAISSSAAEGGIGVTYTMISPISGLRLLSTAVTTTTITLKALQSVSG